jgi:hypothetical protein
MNDQAKSFGYEQQSRNYQENGYNLQKPKSYINR